MLCRHLMVGLLSSVLQYRMRWYSRWLRQQDPVHSSQEQLWRLSGSAMYMTLRLRNANGLEFDAGNIRRGPRNGLR